MKRLFRSRDNRIIAGVCGGIGEYFDVDPVLIRVIAILARYYMRTGTAEISKLVQDPGTHPGRRQSDQCPLRYRTGYLHPVDPDAGRNREPVQWKHGLNRSPLS